MNIKEIAFTSYPINDVPAARKFYEEILGLKATSVFESEGMAFIEYDLGNGTLAIGKGAKYFTAGVPGASIAFEVEDFDAAVASLKAAKVPFVFDPMDTSVCHMVLVKDPDGNQVMIHKRKNK